MKKIKNIFLTKKNLKRDIAIISLSFLTIFSAAYAGNLDSPGSPGATSYTLSDIHTRLTTNAAATEGDHDFFPSSDPSSSLFTLKQIYDAIPTILPETVKFGTPYLGVAGALLPSGGTAAAENVLFGETFFGASQANWTLQTGTMANIGQQTITPETTNQTITEGYHSGTGYVVGDADLTAGKIKSGVDLFGVSGDYPSATYPLSGDTIADDATVAEICDGDEAWTKAGLLLAGTLNPTAASIGVGHSYCGVAGTLLKNQFNGSAGGSVADSAFYTQANGGVDDYNNGGARPDDYYKVTWTTCNAGNDYCGTDDATNADRKDDSTQMIWSKWLDGGATRTWFWANNCYEPSTVENPGTCVNNGDDACQCVKKPEGLKTGCEAISGWRLPHQKELMQAYINNSWGNLSSAGTNYWSATTTSNTTQTAWRVNLLNGNTLNANKTNSTANRVRCVR